MADIRECEQEVGYKRGKDSKYSYYMPQIDLSRVNKVCKSYIKDSYTNFVFDHAVGVGINDNYIGPLKALP